MKIQNLEIIQTTNLLTEEFKRVPPKTFSEVNWDLIRLLNLTVEQYSQETTIPLKERAKVYKDVSAKVRYIASQINCSKSLFEKFCSFFIHLSDEERFFATSAKKLCKLEKNTQQQYEKVWEVINQLTSKHLENSKNHINSQEYKPKYCAFRLVNNHLALSDFANRDNRLLSCISLLGDLKAFKKDHGSELKASDQAELELHIQKLKKLRKQVAKIEAISYSFGTTSSLYRNSRQEAFVDHLHIIFSQIKSLKAGESTILYGGYGSLSGGHSVIYEVKHTVAGRYSFTIHNTGDGALNHQSILQSLYTPQHARSVAFENLSLEAVTSIELLKKLVEILESETTPSHVIPSMNYIDTVLQAHFKSPPKLGPLHHLQTNGTCALDSLICWLSQSLNPALFELLQLYIKKRAMSVAEKIEEKSWVNDQCKKKGDVGAISRLLKNHLVNKESLKTWGQEAINKQLELFYSSKKEDSYFSQMAEKARNYVFKDWLNLEIEPKKPSKEQCQDYSALAERIANLS